MKAFSPMLILLLSTLIVGNSHAESRRYDSYQIAIEGVNTIQTSNGSIGSAKAATDTFYIYGGPGTAEGRFQTLEASPGGARDTQGWVGHDLTGRPPIWRASTINASSVGDGNPQGFTGGLENHAVISQHNGPDYFGVGHSWDDWLVFRYDLSAGDWRFDPEADTTTVRLTCEYKYNVMPDYDYLRFEWGKDVFRQYQGVLFITGSSYNDNSGLYEKRDLDSDEHGGIRYLPGDYYDNTQITLRIRVTSDGGWDDEDGLWPTEGRGAAAVDNIRVFVNGELVSFADWEPLVPKVDLPEGDITGHDNGAALGTEGWRPEASEFVGEFAKIFTQFVDIDVCRDNITPQFTFINDGTPPSNAPGETIAPSISPTWTYGLPSSYVVDFNGGLTNGVLSLDNEIWSPVIAWDLLGPEDDVVNGGAVLGYTRWSHMPLSNGIFAVWHVRSRLFGSDWSGWEDNNFVYYSPSGVYGNFTVDVTDKLVQNADEVQIAMGVTDLADVFGFPGTDATPAPLYDNIYLKKYAIAGPVISTRTIDLASDCFPIDGTLTGSCRFDANIDRNAEVLVPGDSIVAEVKAIIPGTALASPTTGGDIVVNQLLNPDFSGARAAGVAAVGGVVIGTDPQSDWDILEYTVAGQQVTNNTGDVIADRYFWDLPDGLTNGLPHIASEDALLFPGDVVQYYLISDDDAGNTTNLPNDLAGFGDFTEGTLYNRIYTLRMLPTMVEGEHPRILFWNDAGHNVGENEYIHSFRQLCLVEGRDFDTYTTKGPSSALSNGLGSAGFRGASPEQLAGYDILVYALGNLSSFSISDGSGSYTNDLGDDLGTLNGWVNADADRYHVYFGNDFASVMMNQGSATQAYLNQVLGVDFLGNDVGPVIDGQVTPLVSPTGLGSGAFYMDHVANGGCLVLNDFDHIGPYVGGSVAAHEFLDPGSIPYPTQVAGSIEWMRIDGNGNTKHSLVFPYDLSFVERPVVGEPPWTLGTTVLLHEVLASFGVSICGGGMDAPIVLPNAPHKFFVRQNHPNPFNPRTRIEFSLPQRGEVRVTLYNVRGERVAVLLDEIREAGPGFVDWNGRDDRAAEVSSGIYLYKVEAAGQEVIQKMALIR